MKLLFAKDGNLFYIKDFRNKEVTEYKNKELIKLIKEGLVIDNVKLVDEKIAGKGFNINNFSRPNSSIGRSYIYKLKLDLTGNIVGYYYIKCNGEPYYINYKDVHKLNKHGVVNGKFFYNSSSMNLTILNKEYLLEEKEYPTVTYTAEEYLDMYNLYSKENLVTVTSRRYDNIEYNNSTGKFENVNYGKSLSSSFIEGHKLLYNLLSKSKITRLTKIYTSFIINNGEIIEIDNTKFFYLVNYEISKNNGTEKLNGNVLIHKNDKRIISLLKGKQVKLSRIKLEDLINLVYCGIEDKYDSVNELMHTVEVKTIDLNLKSETIQNFEIRNGYFVNTNTNNKLPIRNGILIGTDRIRNILYVS